jgi:hypothetical protein
MLQISELYSAASLTRYRNPCLANVLTIPDAAIAAGDLSLAHDSGGSTLRLPQRRTLAASVLTADCNSAQRPMRARLTQSTAGTR